MVHLCPKSKFQYCSNIEITFDAEEKTIACGSASHEDRLMIFCLLLLLNNGQLFNAWNPPDVDFLWLLCPLQSESENVSKHQ